MTANKNSLKDVIQIEVSGSEPCVKNVKFTVPAEAVERETNSMLKEFAKFAQVPGFRTGKTPLSLIRSRFLPRIEAETIKNFFTAAFEKVSSDEKFDVVSYTFPQAQPEKLEVGKDYSFTIVFNVSPEIKLGAYKGIKISVPEAKVVEGLVDAIVEVTETGSTIKAHGLRIVHELMESNTQLIANKKSVKDTWKQKKIEQIRILLNGALQAENRVGLKMNIAEEYLDKVTKMLPSLKAPTIAKLYKQEWYSVETIVDKNIVRELIPKLQEAGAEGIIEYPSNKVV